MTSVIRLIIHVNYLQESIIYSYDLATVPSILPAFANSRDLIVVDEVCPRLAFHLSHFRARATAAKSHMRSWM